MTPEEALAVVHNGISQLDLERVVRETGGSWEHVRRTGEFRVRYSCMPKPSGPANGRKKDASRATVSYVRSALRAMVGEAVAAEYLDVTTDDIPALRAVDQWTAAAIETDHEEALRLNAEWLPSAERDRIELEMLALMEKREAANERQRAYYQRVKNDPAFKAKCHARYLAKKAADPDYWKKHYEKLKTNHEYMEYQRAKGRAYYQKHKGDPAFIERYRASWKKSKAKKLAADPDYEKKRSKEYRDRLDREDPGMRALMSHVHNKKCKDKKKLDPEWRANKNRINRESWARKKAEAMAVDPEKFKAEHARKVREWKAKKRAETKLLAEIEAEIKAEVKS